MKLVYFLSILMLSQVANATELNMPVKSVYDGDTIITEFSCSPSELKRVSIRLIGIDTPELRQYKCAKEKDLAIKARSRVIELLQVGTSMKVDIVKWDKYGGRIDAYVYTKEGINVGKTLIDEGLAVSYSGRGFKKNWCN